MTTSRSNRRRFLQWTTSLAAGAALAPDLLRHPALADGASGTETSAAGPFQPSWESLQQYRCPDWFRDAKFGIWAHWTAQCVPEQGDWYARKMYIEGDPDYRYHLDHYGHPSRVGFKEIDHLWHAEHWEPEKLIHLYQQAGAKYFVALANHHDNFDCFNSKHQPWNSVNLGPRRDIVGTWARAARRAGLRFGATVHAARAWSWFEVAQGADKEGPLAGVPYDGKLTKADGKGKWWDGYDPQELYAQNHAPGEKPDPAYIDKFYHRVIDLVDSYHPDLLYFDDSVMPLQDVSDAGLRIAAHYYNASLQRHGGKLEAVMTTKGLDEEQRRCLVWDIERGITDRIEPYPWQTDTCVGDWHYRRSLFERHRYKTPTTVIHMLADIVSKNGNLLLNIPVRGDGTIDADEIAFLEEMARWMKVNGEAIFGTRPWKHYGEGPSTEATSAPRRGANFNERSRAAFTAQDIRFTGRGPTLYAIALGWPADGQVVIQSLGTRSPDYDQDIAAVHLLGSPAKLQWKRDENGLAIALPAQKPGEHAFAFKITPARRD
jgi:alpha-L-fucosidase